MENLRNLIGTFSIIFFNFQFYYSRWQWMSIKWVSYDARRSCKDINPGGDIYN